MPGPTTLGMRARNILLLLAAWFTFFALLDALSAALEPSHAYSFGPVEFVGAILWTVLSAVVAGYHRRLRARISSIGLLVLAHVPLLGIALIADASLTTWAMSALAGAPSKVGFTGLLVFYFDFDVVAYGLIIACTEVGSTQRALADRERQAERLKQSLARARLDYLEAQLQPHFLFNSLGAVSELAYDAPATATRVLRQLASIFRTALGRKTDEITLGEEIVGIEPYLDIQRIRFADWLTIDYRIDDSAVDYLVPRFVLQPLIENAIRHGLSGRHSAGTIEISAIVQDATLIVRVADNGVGLDATHPSSGRGIGLTNVRDRLRILYGNDDSLRLTSNEAGGAISELRIPARRRDVIAESAPTERIDPQLVEMPRSLHFPRLLRNTTVASLAVWSLCGLAWTQQSWSYLALRGRLSGTTWFSLARIDLLSAAIWAFLTPVVLHFTKRLPLQRRGIVWRSIAYAVFAVGIVIAHNLIWHWVVTPGISFFSQQYEMSLVVGFLIAGILLMVGNRAQLREWLTARESRAERLRDELEEARRRAKQLQEIPPILLRSLDGIADTARRDPTLTERQLTRLADYVRLALECTDDRGITPDRERQLAAAVAELEATGAYSLTLSA